MAPNAPWQLIMRILLKVSINFVYTNFIIGLINNYTAIHNLTAYHAVDIVTDIRHKIHSVLPFSVLGSR